MKPALILLLLMVLTCGVAYADEAPEPPVKVNLPVDTMCQKKRPDELCKLEDGSGGVCVPFTCDKGECLKCLAPISQKSESNLWIPMLAFGITVTVVGAIFWLRLRKLWG